MKPLSRMKLFYSFSIYIIAALLMWLQTHYTIPYLSGKTGQEPILLWFIVGALGIFFPLILLAIAILKSEIYKLTYRTWYKRMRFVRMTGPDWLWSILGILVTTIGMLIVMGIIALFVDKLDYTPSFMEFEPLGPGRYWLLAVWFVFWIFNIMGEEILWRGVMQPRQELVSGQYTWIVQGIGWSLFHLAFGWQLWVMLLPLMFIQPYIVQKTRNSWTGVIIHGAINGPGFIAIALDMI
ncbi:MULTISPECIES: CPBP family intramembrane glutamic endopeptidase [Parabacteroides]|uniref:CPBP family intramembrane glutamic endopeptidase n=1 Tax=Parabacteroides leei TaxID=2939491 RepID=UPI001899AA9C|nr:CPBP family intramembrane glutamic endopeptidase [Parabacteroides goldsteinii]